MYVGETAKKLLKNQLKKPSKILVNILYAAVALRIYVYQAWYDKNWAKTANL